MAIPIRIDGPVKISPDCRIDLTPYLNGVEYCKRGFDIDFKVCALVTEDDQFTVEESTVHSISSTGNFHASFSFECEADIPEVRHIDFALSPGNDIFLVACDATVKAVLLEYVDITPH
jgi:hypothetical protein